MESFQEDDEDDSMSISDEARDKILYDIDEDEERQAHMNLLLNMSKHQLKEEETTGKERQSLSGSTQEMSNSLLKQKLHLSLSKLN